MLFVGLLDVFSPDVNLEEFQQIYLVMHLMSSDMTDIIRIQHDLSDEHVQYFIYQILRGLKYIHSAGIIHRDLKPSNIGVNKNCELKILDFGLARYIEPEMTGYVVTRWYRAPEIALNWMHYNQTVDIWSVGCILAELLTGKILFPGSDHLNQLDLIMQLLGPPSQELIQKIPLEFTRNYIQGLPSSQRREFRELFRDVDPLAVNLLELMLELDPDKRITAEQALAHQYLEKFVDPSDEAVSDPYEESFPNVELPVDYWKELVWIEMINFKRRGPTINFPVEVAAS